MKRYKSYMFCFLLSRFIFMHFLPLSGNKSISTSRIDDKVAPWNLYRINIWALIYGSNLTINPHLSYSAILIWKVPRVNQRNREL